MNFQKAINLKSAELRTLKALIKLALICSALHGNIFIKRTGSVSYMKDEEILKDAPKHGERFFTDKEIRTHGFVVVDPAHPPILSQN